MEPCPSWCGPDAHSAQFASDFDNHSAAEYFDNRDLYCIHHREMHDGSSSAVVLQQAPRQEVCVELAVFSAQVRQVVTLQLTPADALALGQALVDSAGKASQR